MKFCQSGVHFPVKNLQATLDYYRDILGFTDEWTWEEKDGGIRRDGMHFLFGEDAAFVNDINNGERRLNVIWFVENIQEVYAEFSKRKIEIVSPLKEYPYAMWEFAFVDINGYYIRIAQSTTLPV